MIIIKQGDGSSRIIRPTDKFYQDRPGEVETKTTDLVRAITNSGVMHTCHTNKSFFKKGYVKNFKTYK
jgi:hypothetical protein